MRSLNLCGWIAQEQGRLEEARQMILQTLVIAVENQNLRTQALGLNNLGSVSSMQGEFMDAQDYVEKSLAICKKMGDRNLESAALNNLGYIASNLGDYSKAQSYIEQHLHIAREVGQPYMVVYGLINLSAISGARGDAQTALSSAQQACELARKNGEHTGEAWALTYLGHGFFATGDFKAAEAAYRDALYIRQDLDQAVLATEPAAGLARVALQRGDILSALHDLEPVLAHLERGGNLDGTDEPLRVYLTCHLVLERAGDPRALRLLETGQRLLDERAAKIQDDARRQAFMNIDHHRAIRQAWERHYRASG